jgi:hypothetical protein
MESFGESNMGLPILGTAPRELLLLDYIILQMPQRKKLDPERMKAAIKYYIKIYTALNNFWYGI